MTTITRCCSCDDEIAPGSDAWKGAHEGETACSMLCRYRSLVEATYGWHLSADSERAAGLARVAATREALLHDPEVFGERSIDVTTKLPDGGSATTSMVPIGVTEHDVHLEVVSGEYQDSDVVLRWESILDMVVCDD